MHRRRALHPTSTGSDTGTLTIDEGAADTDTFSLSGTGVANRFSLHQRAGEPRTSARHAVGDTSDRSRSRSRTTRTIPADPNVHLGGPDPATSTSPHCEQQRLTAERLHGNRQLPARSSQGAKSATLQIDGDSFDVHRHRRPAGRRPAALTRLRRSARGHEQRRPAGHVHEQPQPGDRRERRPTGIPADYNVKRAAAAARSRGTAARSWSSSRRTRSGSRTAH